MGHKNKNTFESILNDYDFFVQHSNESEMNRLALRERIRARGQSEAKNILDFGCGSGQFLSDLVQSIFAPEAELDICLVEPSASYRSSAEKAFSNRPNVKISVWEEFDATRRKRYDLILSNHVLYYIKDLKDLFARFFRAAHPTTQILITMGSDNNALNEILKSACHLIDSPAPNKSAEDLTEYLQQEEISFKTTYVESHLEFSDLPTHRDQVLRFILGPHASEFETLPRELLDPYKKGKNINVPLFDVVFEVKPKFAVGEIPVQDRRKFRRAG